jgi:hypothetical protein
MRAAQGPEGSISASLYLVHTEKWCVLSGSDVDVRHGPYLALDRDGSWIEWGEYEAVQRNGVADRRVGPWHHRVPGDCGDWIEWSTWPGPVRPTPEQSRALSGGKAPPWREAECGGDRVATLVSSTRASLEHEDEPQRLHAAYSKVCLAKDRTPDGPAWTWFENGEPRTFERQVQGVRHGEFRAFHSNGRPRWEGSFRQGREQGLWRELDCVGVPRCEGHAEAGRIVGVWQCASGDDPPLVNWLGKLGAPPTRPPPGSR